MLLLIQYFGLYVYIVSCIIFMCHLLFVSDEFIYILHFTVGRINSLLYVVMHRPEPSKKHWRFNKYITKSCCDLKINTMKCSRPEMSFKRIRKEKSSIR